MAVLGVSVDPTEMPARLRRYRAEYNLPWDLVRGDTEIIMDYNVRSQATLVALDDTGVIIQRTSYGMRSSADWQSLFDKLLVTKH